VTGVRWLASYPKSGNTWVRAVWAAASTGADVDINQLPGGAVPATRELLDDALGLTTADLTDAEVAALRPYADDVVAAEMPEPTLRKVHDLFTGPSGAPIVSVAAARGVIYVVRDPRDVAVSQAGFSGRPLDSIVGRMSNPATRIAATGYVRHVPQRLGTWSQHVRGWLDQDLLPVHLLRYEDAVADPVGAFGPLLSFAGLALTTAEVTAAVERASFRELAGQEAGRGFRERWRADAPFFRRGRAGGWRDELPPELADRLAADHAEVMSRLGYCD
jgi:hypothetical protein